MFLASNFLVPNGTFVVELIAFLLLVFVIGRYILPPINKAVAERQATLGQALTDAETAKRRAEEAEVDYGKTLERARVEARSMVEEASKQAEQLRRDRQEQAEREYQARLERAEADIQASARRAAEDVRREVANLVLTVVERVVHEGFDTDAHRALIDRTISEVEHEASSAPEVNA